MSRFNATVQFPSEADHQKLKALSILMENTMGDVIKRLVDTEAEKYGLKVGAWEPKKKQIGKAPMVDRA